MSRLLARCAVSGLAAKSSMAAASMASWRFCARSMSRSSRHRAQRKSPSSRRRYAHLRHPPVATSAARLLRQLAARRSRQGWHEAAHSWLALTAHGRRQRGWQHWGGSPRMTAGGTKPGGNCPLHWAMRVSRFMVISCSDSRRGVRRCLGRRHARAGRSPRASEVGACGEPAGLTGRARVTRWRGRRTTGPVVEAVRAERRSGWRASRAWWRRSAVENRRLDGARIGTVRLTCRRAAPHSPCHASAAETRMPG